jgi:RNA polymerase sigma-70 factor (ECF subfamily)
MTTDRDDTLGERAAEPSDAELVRRSQRDLDEFVALYDRHVEAIYRYCSRRLDRAAAEDATSTTFLNALAAIRGLDSRRAEAFRPWLFTIARHAVIDQLRRQRGELIDELDLTDDGPLPDDLAILADRRERLSQAMSSLGPDQRRVVRLRLAGMQDPEIGEALGKSPGAIRVIHHRAVARLRDLLGERTSRKGANHHEAPER